MSIPFEMFILFPRNQTNHKYQKVLDIRFFLIDNKIKPIGKEIQYQFIVYSGANVIAFKN